MMPAPMKPTYPLWVRLTHALNGVALLVLIAVIQRWSRRWAERAA